jgi:hypothetical protein
MRAVAIALISLFLSACGAGGGDTGVIVSSCSGFPILTPEQVSFVKGKFPLFQPELYCTGTDIRSPSTFAPENYTPARFLGSARLSAEQVTPLGITFQPNGFHAEDIQLALPTQVDYFDIEGRPFTVALPSEEGDRQIRVSASQIDSIFLTVREELRVQFPQFPEMQQVQPSSLKVNFQASVFYIAPLNTWAGGVTSGNGRSIDVAVFHLSPRVKTPISWRGIPGVSSSWLAHEIRNAIFIQSGHPELAT